MSTNAQLQARRSHLTRQHQYGLSQLPLVRASVIWSEAQILAAAQRSENPRTAHALLSALNDAAKNSRLCSVLLDLKKTCEATLAHAKRQPNAVH